MTRSNRAVRERRVVEQAAVKLRAAERRVGGQILEVDPGRGDAVAIAQPAEKGPHAAPDVEHFVCGIQRHVARHQPVLRRVELVHRAFEGLVQRAPVGLAVRDVLVVVVILDVFEGHARILVGQAAPVAADELEDAGLARQVVLRLDERTRGAAAAAVTDHVFEERCWSDGQRNTHREPPKEKTGDSGVVPPLVEARRDERGRRGQQPAGGETPPAGRSARA